MKGSTIISKNNVRLFLKHSHKRVAVETFKTLEREVRSLLVKAAERAERNHRSTVMSQDI